MRYPILIIFGLAYLANANILAARARCTDRCAVAIASDSNPAVHTSQVEDCQSYLGTTYYPTVRWVIRFRATFSYLTRFIQRPPYCYHDRDSKQRRSYTCSKYSWRVQVLRPFELGYSCYDKSGRHLNRSPALCGRTLPAAPFWFPGNFQSLLDCLRMC